MPRVSTECSQSNAVETLLNEGFQTKAPSSKRVDVNIANHPADHSRAGEIVTLWQFLSSIFGHLQSTFTYIILFITQNKPVRGAIITNL